MQNVRILQKIDEAAISPWHIYINRILFFPSALEFGVFLLLNGKSLRSAVSCKMIPDELRVLTFWLEFFIMCSFG